MKKILVCLLAICMLLSGCKKTVQEPSETMYGVWVATTKNLDFPSRAGLSESEISAETDQIIDTAASCGINCIFLQVCANADAIYPDALFGCAASLYGTRNPEKELKTDILAEFLEKAHQKNIKVYAWINPYRVGSGEADEIVKSLGQTHPLYGRDDLLLKYSGGVCMNPGVPETRELVLAMIREIVERYKVDGVVFDDYFYPYERDYDDSETYQKYGANFKTVDDFRRYSVNRLISRCSEYLREKGVPFGVSPFAIWQNKSEDAAGSDTNGLCSYSAIYSDSRLWVKKEWVDFISPQIYWSFENEKAGFEQVFNWWNDLCEDTNVAFYVSHYVSRIGSELAGWESSEQLARQLSLCSKMNVCSGSVFFRIGDFIKNEYNEVECVKKYKY